MLLLAHRKELLHQAALQISNFNRKDLKISFEVGKLHACVAESDVILASVQTLGRNGSARLATYSPDLFKAVIIDEAHHASAATYQTVLKALNVYGSRGRHIKVWGCSATLRRHDGTSLKPTFEEIIYHVPVSKMIEDKWLTDLRIQTVKTKIILGDIKTLGGDFNLKELSSKVNTFERNQIILQTFKEQRALHNRKSILIFAVDVAHIEDLVETFRTGGIEVSSIHGKTGSRERAEILERFKTGEIQVVINCGILTEGVDIPCVDMIILARPTKSGALLQQMLGRGMRLSPGKEFCLVLDFVDNVDNRMMLATIPTLLGLDPLHTMSNESIRNRVAQLSGGLEESSDPDDDSDQQVESPSYSVQVTLKPFVNPFSLDALSKDSLYLKKHSDLSWTRCGPKKFILSIQIGIYAKLEFDDAKRLWIGEIKQIVKTAHGRLFHNQVYTEQEEDGDGVLTRFIPTIDDSWADSTREADSTRAVPKRVPITSTHDNFQDAIKSLDNLVKKKYGYRRLKWNSKWRTEPASSGQVKFLSKLGIDCGRLGKGDASDLISRRIFGAIKNAAKAQSLKRKQDKDSGLHHGFRW